MAASNAGGYEHEFLEDSAKLKDFECPLCLHVTREPSLTSCCGQHFCQSCINRIITGSKPCPFCKEKTFTILLDKKQKRKVLELKVSCTMKDRGCTWTGNLGDLNTHSDVQNGSCQYVDVNCSNKCGKNVQRRHLPKHLSEECPKRPFTCKYCLYKATYDDVSTKHYSKCAKYPIPCPNECDIGNVERAEMEEHLSKCPLQLVDCEFAHAGCSEKITRKNSTRHMEQNIHRHLSMLSTLCLKQTAEMQQKLDEKDKEIALLKNRLDYVENYICLLPEVFQVDNFSKVQRGVLGRVSGPVGYIHLGGAKVKICLYKDDQVDVELWQIPGTFDEASQWPVEYAVSVQLLNQLGDHHHYTGSEKRVKLTKPENEEHVMDILHVFMTDLIYNHVQQSQYLKDDCLKFKISAKVISVGRSK